MKYCFPYRSILGNDFPDDPRARRLILDPHAAARRWYDKHRLVPTNHVFVAHEALWRQRPDVVQELYRVLSAGRTLSGAPEDPDPHPFGVAAMAPARAYAIEQHLSPLGFTTDALLRSIVG